MRAEQQNWWAILAIAEIVLFMVPLAYWSFRTSFPYGDGLMTFDFAVRHSWSAIWASLFQGTTEFRPLYFSAVRLVHDLAGGPSVPVFRTIQVGFIALDLALFYLLFRPATAATWFGFTLATSCYVGLHTSMDNLTASTPLPFGPVVFALMLGTLLLLRREPSGRIDVAAGAMSLLAVFFIEYGIAVGLMWLVAGLLRLGAARRRTALWAMAGIGVYAALRLSTNAQPLPGPFYTETGYVFRMLGVPEQQALFGDRPWLFGLYNVVSTFSSVLLSEPRAGQFRAVSAFLNDTPIRPWQALQWTSSLMATALLLAWASTWRRLDADARRSLVLGAVVIVSISMLSYMYTRDRIPTAAGMYYALLAGFAGTWAWQRRAHLATPAHAAALTLLLVALVTAWGNRAAGTILTARDQAWMVQDEWRRRGGGDQDSDELTDHIRLELKRRALGHELPDPRQDPAWRFAWFERKLDDDR